MKGHRKVMINGIELSMVSIAIGESTIIRVEGLTSFRIPFVEIVERFSNPKITASETELLMPSWFGLYGNGTVHSHF